MAPKEVGSTNRLTPEYIASMSPDQRNLLLSQSPQQLEEQFTGFLDGSLLREAYNPIEWLPEPDLQDAMLFAGKGSFEGLQDYTYSFIQNNSVTLQDIKYPIKSESIESALGMVERFMAPMRRRTGEPSIAHIYRTLLRTSNVVDYFNNLHNTKGLNTRFTPDLAELMYLSAILHDFQEDQVAQSDTSYQVGIIKHIPSKPETGSKAKFYLRRAKARSRGRYSPTPLEKDISLEINPFHMSFLKTALQALNSSSIAESSIVDFLLNTVESQYKSITLYDIDQYILCTLPAYIKCCADRPDNLATYFTQTSRPGETTVTPVERIIGKAKENLDMFNEAEIHMLHDGPDFIGSAAFEETDKTTDSTSILPFFPSRWAKLALLGLNPNQMYTIPENGGLPHVI